MDASASHEHKAERAISKIKRANALMTRAKATADIKSSKAASKSARDEYKSMGEEYGLYRKGGSVGEKDDHPRHGKLISKHATPEEAKGEAKAHNKTLSAGEKKYYRMKYHVKPMKEESLDEKAPPGAKFERMVKHIKKGYSKDGLTSKEKSIAYATAWKEIGRAHV